MRTMLKSKRELADFAKTTIQVNSVNPMQKVREIWKNGLQFQKIDRLNADSFI
jgi:hypothetical protein